MKLSILAATAALALAATVAAAQPDTRSGPVYGYQAPEPSEPVGPPRPPSRPEEMDREIANGLKVAVPEVRFACAADRQSLCAESSNDRATQRCLAYHRLKLSASCKKAMVDLELARRGAL